MDFLKAEIARKRKQVKETVDLKDGQKSFKRSELAAAQRELYLKKQEESAAKRKKYVDSQQNAEGEVGGGHAEDLNSPTDMMPGEEEAVLLPRNEVIRRLRDRDEPIRLFAESDEEACKRLRRIEILTPDVTKGLRNDFQAAMDKIEAEEQAELLRHESEQNPTTAEEDIASAAAMQADDDTTMENIVEMSKKAHDGDDIHDQAFLLKYLKFILALHARELNDRPKEVKQSPAGRLDSAIHSQTESYLKPLLKLLRKRRTPPDILPSLTLIGKYMVERQYVVAGDWYLRMAIGNAAWPIGVTMVGIHARTGREKIFAQHVAHVLNDETQRKYIQALKRLMTFCQRVFPADPSKCVR
ncbi:pre-mRNA-splicing factor 18-like [Sycon ciliatum]|uniref:pre-mRNA-splicing factor 18-like n=1 Tax=Sycon ciliatum TaxID=27933 RepID=UPI0031F69C85